MKTEWDLTHLYKNDEEWQKDKESLELELQTAERLLLEPLDHKMLLQIIQSKIKIDCQIEKIYVWPRRHLDLDSENTNYTLKMKEAWALYNQTIIFSEKVQKIIMDHNDLIETIKKTNPQWQRYLSLIEKNNLYQTIEFNSTIRDIYGTLVNIDMQFAPYHDEDGKEQPITSKNLTKIMSTKPSNIRKEALSNYTDSYAKINHTLALLLVEKFNNEIKQAKKNGFTTLLNKKMTELELPNTILPNFLKEAYQHRELLKLYIDQKKKFLNLSKFTNYDVNLPTGLISKITYSLEDAIQIIKEALSCLGEDYVSHIDQAFEEGWVDVYPHDKKRKNSFSCISYNGAPYALLNYNKSILSVRTLAHELGHSIHTFYAKENDFENFEYSLFLAEIVSKVNEILLNEYLLTLELNQDEKEFILNDIIASLCNTLFGQALLTEFEHTIISSLENNQSKNAEEINTIYKEIHHRYYEDNMVCEVENKYDWSKISHFFCVDSYYLYQYPIGLSIALEITKKMKTNPEKYIPKYIDFLRIGNTKDITSSLQTLDIDLTQETYLQNAYNYLENKLFELQKVRKNPR